MTRGMLLTFDGVSRPVALVECEDLVACISSVLAGWPFAALDAPPARDPIITIRRTDEGFSLDAPWRQTPIHYRDRVDTVCTFIVDLVRAYIADDTSLLCLHCAAAEFSGRLVVFPNRRRAGKSTLTVYLAAAGARIYADDILPIKAHGNRGSAPGIAPRLRLPLPENADAAFRDYVRRRSGLSNKRYLYLELGPDALASRGEEAPIGGFVLLHRVRDAPPRLERVRRSDILRSVIVQNFARDVEAVDVLRRARSLVEQAQCYRLRYSDGAQAVDLLRKAFDRPPVRRRRARRGRAAATAPPVAAHRGASAGPRIRRNPDVVETAVDRELFLANPDNQAICHLNAIGTALWRLMAEPIGVEQAIGLLHEAFPDVPREQIERDVNALVADLTARGLVSHTSNSV